jgi:hypothetical protein
MEKVVIFGASVGGERGLRSLPHGKKAVAFCDNDAGKHGTRYRGLPVIAPTELKSIQFDRILVASSYYPEIFNQLVDLQVPLDRIDILDAAILNGEDDPSAAV